MSQLSWVRAARRFTGLPEFKELPYLESLMESEQGQNENDYRILALVLPTIFFAVGAAVFITLAFKKSPLFLIGTGGFWLAAIATYIVCDRMDKAVSAARKRLRKSAGKVWQRYRGFKNLVGVQPALSPRVGEILDVAAAIYLKHAQPVRFFERPAPETTYIRSQRAMEDAMAQMLQLAVPETATAQELELSKGWALPLLAEMQALDRAMEHSGGLAGYSSPLLGLREARREIEGLDAARVELDQRLNS